MALDPTLPAADSLESADAAGPRPAPPLVFAAAAVATGIVVDRVFSGLLVFSIGIGLFALAFWLVLWRGGRHAAATWALAVGLAAAGHAWHHTWWRLYPAEHCVRSVGDISRPLAAAAVAASRGELCPAPPRNPMAAIPEGDTTIVEIRVTGLRHLDQWRPATGAARLVVQGHLLNIEPGDELKVFGQAYRLSGPDNLGEFDYAAHQRADRKLFEVRAGFPDCVTQDETQAERPAAPMRFVRRQLVGMIDALRTSAAAAIDRHIEGPENALAHAMLLGDRDHLEEERTRAFFETGVIHVMAVSGLHVGILSGFIALVCRGLGFSVRRTALVVLGAAVVYTLVTGARPPAVRTTALVALICGAGLAHRKVSSFNLLAAAALVVLALNPADLFRSGAQLSFLAVATLMWVGPRLPTPRARGPLQRLILSSRPWWRRRLREIAIFAAALTLAGAAVWVVATPLVLTNFRLLAPVAILLSPVAWAPVTLALALGFAMMLLDPFLPAAAGMCGAGCQANLALLEWLVGVAHDIPGGHVYLGGPPLWWTVVAYGLMAWAASGYPLHVRGKRRLAVLFGWAALGALLLPAAPSQAVVRNLDEPKLEVAFIDVGHGSSVLLRSPDGLAILYDCGSLASPKHAADAVSGVLWAKGVTRLDTIIISHADADHFNGLPRLLMRFAVGQVLVSPMMFDRDAASLEELKAVLAKHKAPLAETYGGDRLRFGRSAAIEVLHPPKRGVLGGDNANSVTLLVEFAGRRLLLPGDIESPGLDDVLAELPTDCDVVMAPHHGSPRSDPEGLMEWATPELVVVSGGNDPRAPEVAERFRAMGAEVRHTAWHGAVTVTLTKDAVRWTTCLPADPFAWRLQTSRRRF